MMYARTAVLGALLNVRINLSSIQETEFVEQFNDYPSFIEGVRRAPDRGYRLNSAQTEIALNNALRYIPVELHQQIAPRSMEMIIVSRYRI